jgi:hypothetical protein
MIFAEDLADGAIFWFSIGGLRFLGEYSLKVHL